MDKTSVSSVLGGNIKYYIWGIVFGVIVTALSLCASAAAMLCLEADHALAAPIATVCVSLGALVGSYFSSYKIGDKGYKIGAIIGLLFFAVITIISLIIKHGGFTANSIFHLVIIVLSSIIGGIMGVNKKLRRKYI